MKGKSIVKLIPNQFKVQGLTSDFWFTQFNPGDALPKGPGMVVFVGETPSRIAGEPRFTITFAITTWHLQWAWTLFPRALSLSGLKWTVGILQVNEKAKLERWSTDLQAGIALRRAAA